MLVSLGNEAELRRLFGFPPVRQLWGAAAHCHWRKTSGPTGADIGELERSPEAAFERLGLTGPTRMAVVDDLMAHAKFGPAMNLAAYLASLPWLGSERRRTGDVFDLKVIVFLRLKEAQAAVEGGYYSRARALMVQLDSLTLALPAGDGAKLVRANVAMLWGRLLQLLWLLRKSLEFLREAEAAFGSELPEGFKLLKARSSLRSPNAIDDIESKKTTSRKGRATTSLFGGLEDHYRHYLKGRIEYASGEWPTAAQSFRSAARLLTQHGHRAAADPIRLAYTNLGLGQALVGEGAASDDAAKSDEGLRLILQAQWQFEHEDNPHGEYLAHRGYSEANAFRLARDEESGIRAQQADYRLSVRSQVPRFQLESGLAWAEALYDYGRPNRVVVLIDEMKHIADDTLATELVASPEWRELMALERRTANARDNSVEPLAPWGISPDAQEERDYVERARREGLLVTVYGPAGSGRRLLVSRIAKARGQDPPEVLDARVRPLAELLVELKSKRRAGAPVILHNFDLWKEPEQVAVLRAVRGTSAWPVGVYITLRLTSAVDSELGDQQSPGLSEVLIAGAFTVAPLAARLQDTLLLARGYLVHALQARKTRAKRTAFDVKDIVFTSAACRYIRGRYKDVRTLNRHMRDLAFRLKDRDFVVAKDDRRRIPVEVIRKLTDSALLAPAGAVQGFAEGAAPPAPATLRDVDLLRANSDTILQLAVHYNGKVATAARAFGVPVSTFRKALEDRGLLQPWKNARSNGREQGTAGE